MSQSRTLRRRVQRLEFREEALLNLNRLPNVERRSMATAGRAGTARRYAAMVVNCLRRAWVGGAV